MPKEPVLSLKEGDPAPQFNAPSNGGGMVSLADFKGQYVVLYFYPKDNTPGCATEACGFRDSYERILARHAIVLGVSVDPLQAHEKFVEKYQLPFQLLSDVSKEIVNAYGVWGKKRFMGREYEGIHRVTFLIDPRGKIQKIWPLVKPGEHAAEVLEALAQ